MIIGDGSEKSSRSGPGETGGADHSDRRADVEKIHDPGSDLRRIRGVPPRWPLGAVALALCSSPLLVASPAMALVATPLTLFALDFGLAAAMGVPGPRAPVRLFGRAVAAASCAIFLRVLLTLGATENEAARDAVVPFVVYGFALFFGLTFTFAAYSSTFSRQVRTAEGLVVDRPLSEATLVLLADSAVTLVALMRTRDAFVFGSLLVAATLCARGLFVVMLARQVQKVPSSPSRAAGAFVVWIGVGGFAAMLARHERPLSGLGAAVVVTVALIGLEARRKIPNAVSALSRATSPWIVLALLSVLSMIVR